MVNIFKTISINANIDVELLTKLYVSEKSLRPVPHAAKVDKYMVHTQNANPALSLRYSVAVSKHFNNRKLESNL